MALRVRTKEEQAQALGITEPKQAFGTTKTIEEQWQELYKSCSCTQERAWYVSCRIDKGMTPEQAREYVAANFTYKEIVITPEDMHRSTIKNRLKRIKSIQVLNGMTPPWAEEVYEEARKLGILNEEQEPLEKPLEESVKEPVKSNTSKKHKSRMLKKYYCG